MLRFFKIKHALCTLTVSLHGYWHPLPVTQSLRADGTRLDTFNLI